MAKPAAPLGCEALGSESGVDQLTFIGLVGECILESVGGNDWPSVSHVPP